MLTRVLRLLSTKQKANLPLHRPISLLHYFNTKRHEKAPCRFSRASQLAEVVHDNIFEQAYPMRNEMENPPVPLPTDGAVQNRELRRFQQQNLLCEPFLNGGFCKTKKKRIMPSHAELRCESNALVAVSVGAFCSEIEPFACE